MGSSSPVLSPKLRSRPPVACVERSYQDSMIYHYKIPLSHASSVCTCSTENFGVWDRLLFSWDRQVPIVGGYNLSARSARPVPIQRGTGPKRGRRHTTHRLYTCMPISIAHARHTWPAPATCPVRSVTPCTQGARRSDGLGQSPARTSDAHATTKTPHLCVNP